MNNLICRKAAGLKPIKGILAGILALAIAAKAGAASPTILSVDPVNGATGVSTSKQVVFTFSTAMYTGSTVIFSNATAHAALSSSPVWSAGNTVLTCSPISAWPASSQVTWQVFGFDASFNQLTGTTTGSFNTGAGGGGGGGTGTNDHTTLSVGLLNIYDQNSTNVPSLDASFAYSFSANVTLASNFSASAISIQMPTAAVSNLNPSGGQPEDWNFSSFTTNHATFTNTFPSGTYVYSVTSGGNTQQVSINLSASITQPGAPRVSNYTAAQNVDPTQPFTLTWDAFPGGTSSDYIAVTVGSWNSPNLGASNLLTGLSNSITIPANTLAANTNYSVGVSFYRYVLTSNTLFSAPYLANGYKVTGTRFTLLTGGGVAAPVITNVVKSAGNMAFDVNFASGQTVTVVGSTNVTTPQSLWPVLLTTNAAGTSFHFIDSATSSSKSKFYRARNGN